MQPPSFLFIFDMFLEMRGKSINNNVYYIMAQNTKDKRRIIHRALKNIIPSDYGIYVSDNKLFIDDFYV